MTQQKHFRLGRQWPVIQTRYSQSPVDVTVVVTPELVSATVRYKQDERCQTATQILDAPHKQTMFPGGGNAERSSPHAEVIPADTLLVN